MANTKSASSAAKNKKPAAKPEKKAPAEELVKEEKVLEEAAAATAAPEAPAPEVKEEAPAAPIEVVAPETEAPQEEPAPEIKVEEKKKILFVASEAAPFIATGGLAEVIGSLSKALAKEDRYDVRVIIPLYQDIKKEYRKDFRFIGNLSVFPEATQRKMEKIDIILDTDTYNEMDDQFAVLSYETEFMGDGRKLSFPWRYSFSLNEIMYRYIGFGFILPYEATKQSSSINNCSIIPTESCWARS